MRDPMEAASFRPFADSVIFEPDKRAVWLDRAAAIRDEAVCVARSEAVAAVESALARWNQIADVAEANGCGGTADEWRVLVRLARRDILAKLEKGGVS